MKIIKTASGKQIIKMSKKEWDDIGEKAGWIKEAQWGQDVGMGEYADMEDPEWMITQIKTFVDDSERFWGEMQFQIGESFKSAKKRQEFLKTMLKKLKDVSPTLGMFTKSEQKAIAKEIIAIKEEEKIEIEDEQRMRDIELEDEQPLAEGPNVALEEPPIGIEQRRDLAPLTEIGHGRDPQPHAPSEMEDAPRFMNKQQIEEKKEEIVNSLLDGEITKEQYDTKLLEFARRVRKITLAAFEGKLKLSKED